MKPHLLCLFIIAALGAATAPAQTQPGRPWKPVAGKMLTPWSGQVSSTAPLPEYPRPQLVRPRWQNLNGLWDFAVIPEVAPRPDQYQGRILVPFAIESTLSGVGRKVTRDDAIWYHRTFGLETPPRPGRRQLLHFGAVDWQASVWINGTLVGTHKGGYDPFTFDITEALEAGRTVDVLVKVWDPSNSGIQPTGKQALGGGTAFYTPVSGIWQTVWLEDVPAAHITAVVAEATDALDAVRVRVLAEGGQTSATVAVSLTGENDQMLDFSKGVTGEGLMLKPPSPRAWTPESPFLYGLKVRLGANGDEVTAYCALRTIAIRRDENGFPRFYLNGEPRFLLGALDQGWWPDGLYTAPTDEALRSDIEATKAMGFNMVRKHVKVEPARWYAWCDVLGLLVWQDMPSGQFTGAEGKGIYRRESEAIREALRPFPSIMMWVLFNEGWGQKGFSAEECRDLANQIEQRDPTRLVDAASGWTDTGAGAVHDMHAYPGPLMHAAEPDRASVLGEFGGLKLAVADHLWQPHPEAVAEGENADLREQYRELIGKTFLLQGQGLAAAVLTQLTDVENELNGLVTYDRKVNKLGEEFVQALSQGLTGYEPVVKVLAGGAEPWRTSTTEPPAGWLEPTFDDREWREACGTFGASELNITAQTPWEEPTLWLRRTFRWGGTPAKEIFLCVLHSGETTVYLNGRALETFKDCSGETFELVPLLERGVVRVGGNTLAVRAEKGPKKFPPAARCLDVRLIAVTDEKEAQFAGEQEPQEGQQLSPRQQRQLQLQRQLQERLQQQFQGQPFPQQ